MIRRRALRARWCVLLISVSPAILAGGQQWRRVAESDLQFANGLASLHVQIGPDLGKLVRQSIDGCDPIPSKMTELDDSQRKQVKLFSEFVCGPWQKEWQKVFRKCDDGPKWCEGDEEGEKHLQFHNYPDTMTQAIATVSDPLARFNIMAVFAIRLDDKIFRDFTEAMVDAWVIPAATAFMKEATPDAVMAIAKVLDHTKYGYSKAIASAFASHAEQAENFTNEQREELKVMAEKAAVHR